MSDPDFPGDQPPPPDAGSNLALLIVSWLWVGVPLAWGVWETVRTSLALFQ
jgi:hypothetical protein